MRNARSSSTRGWTTSAGPAPGLAVFWSGCDLVCDSPLTGGHDGPSFPERKIASSERRLSKVERCGVEPASFLTGRAWIPGEGSRLGVANPYEAGRSASGRESDGAPVEFGLSRRRIEAILPHIEEQSVLKGRRVLLRDTNHGPGRRGIQRLFHDVGRALQIPDRRSAAARSALAAATALLAGAACPNTPRDLCDSRSKTEYG